jgi:hypothetical protein
MCSLHIEISTYFIYSLFNDVSCHAIQRHMIVRLEKSKLQKMWKDATVA